MATSIQTGLICWASGPWRAGLWNEETIFKNGLYHQLDIGKQVHADRGYSAAAQDDNGNVIFITPNTREIRGSKDSARALTWTP